MPCRRARPWLGTLVEIRIDNLDAEPALAAIDAAFAEIAAVHRLMSFHSRDSDLARLHRDAARDAVAIDARTAEVVALALEVARESDGRFDPTVARELVAWNHLPKPADAPAPDPEADWCDVAIEGHAIRFLRPVWLDLGGIAKGYAVDRAIACLEAHGVAAACVNAGGDLRRIGAGFEAVHVRPAHAPDELVAAIELGRGALATSGSQHRRRGVHVDRRRRARTGAASTASVVAERCAIADALTKVALLDPDGAAPVLERYDASASVCTERGGWRRIGAR